MAAENSSIDVKSATMEDGSIVLDHEQVRAIRRALLVGLSAYGECERLDNLFLIAKMAERPLPDEHSPLHPTGSADTVSEFATALRYLDS